MHTYVHTYIHVSAYALCLSVLLYITAASKLEARRYNSLHMWSPLTIRNPAAIESSLPGPIRAERIFFKFDALFKFQSRNRYVYMCVSIYGCMCIYIYMHACVYASTYIHMHGNPPALTPPRFKTPLPPAITVFFRDSGFQALPSDGF